MTFIGNDDKKKTKSADCLRRVKRRRKCSGQNRKSEPATEESGLPSINKCVQKIFKNKSGQLKMLSWDFLD